MKKYFLGLLLIMVLSQCSLFDSDELIPAYLVIDEVSLTTSATQGPSTHKITDVWVYADNQLLGVFELPARIPVIVNEAQTSFEIFAGIRNNGEVSRSFIYRFFKSDQFTVGLAPGDEVVRNSNFTYIDELKIDFLEDFEGAHIFSVDLDDDPATSLVSTDEDAKTGSRSGKMELNADQSEVIVTTLFTYDGSKNSGSDSYLEMDYKSDQPFVVGVIYTENGLTTRTPLIILDSKEDWNKIYIDYTLALSSPTILQYQVFLALARPDGASSAKVLVDNLKFLHL